MLNKTLFAVSSKFNSRLAVALAAIMLVVGCATSPKVQVVQVGDNALTKEQIQAEIAKLNEADRVIDSKKGVTGTNVAAALFFWPGLLFTHMDASEATRLVEQRRNHLTNLYNQKFSAAEGRKSRS